MSSGYRSFSLSTSTIESNGFRCKGLKPVANLDVLQNPSEPHFRKSQGIPGWCNFWAVTPTETAEKERAPGSLKRNRFLALEAMLLQIFEVEDTLCIAESENEEKKRTWELAQWQPSESGAFQWQGLVGDAFSGCRKGRSRNEIGIALKHYAVQRGRGECIVSSSVENFNKPLDQSWQKPERVKIRKNRIFGSKNKEEQIFLLGPKIRWTACAFKNKKMNSLHCVHIIWGLTRVSPKSSLVNYGLLLWTTQVLEMQVFIDQKNVQKKYIVP